MTNNTRERVIVWLWQWGWLAGNAVLVAALPLAWWREITGADLVDKWVLLPFLLVGVGVVVAWMYVKGWRGETLYDLQRRWNLPGARYAIDWGMGTSDYPGHAGCPPYSGAEPPYANRVWLNGTDVSNWRIVRLETGRFGEVRVQTNVDGIPLTVDESPVIDHDKGEAVARTIVGDVRYEYHPESFLTTTSAPDSNHQGQRDYSKYRNHDVD